MEQIEGELKRVKAANGNPKQVFLGDGNAFGRKTEDLLKILDMIHNYFPACEGVNMDAAITDISRSSKKLVFPGFMLALKAGWMMF